MFKTLLSDIPRSRATPPPAANTNGANTAVGAFALGSTITGGANTAVGYGALFTATGGANIALGDLAGVDVTTGSGNIIIGNRGLADDAGTIRIGRAAQTKCYIAGIRDVTTGVGDAIPVVIDSASQLGTVSSSKRFKKEIKPMDNASEAVLGTEAGDVSSTRTIRQTGRNLG